MAREAAVTVRAGESEADWKSYYAVYEKSLRRWGDGATSRYPRPLFGRIAALPADAMRLWLAEHEGRVAAGYVAFYHNRHACIWHGASDPELYRLGAVQALYAGMIADAASRGFGAFDLLGSGGIASLEAFKKTLGAETLAFESCLNRAGVLGRLAAWRAGRAPAGSRDAGTPSRCQRLPDSRPRRGPRHPPGPPHPKGRRHRRCGKYGMRIMPTAHAFIANSSASPIAPGRNRSRTTGSPSTRGTTSTSPSSGSACPTRAASWIWHPAWVPPRCAGFREGSTATASNRTRPSSPSCGDGS